MRLGSGALSFAALLAVVGVSISVLPAEAGQAQATGAARDIPANHWARKDVDAVVRRGVMRAPGGKFNGDRRVTRTDLILAMASFGQSLERRAWQPAVGRRFKLPIKDDVPANSQGVTRYELAAILARMGPYAAAGTPRPKDKRFGNSEALPKAADVSGVKKTDPAYASVRYLSRNRMIWPNSVLSRPGPEDVTGKDVAQAVAAVITGVIDVNTDEPQNKPEIAPPPSDKRGRPERAGNGAS